MEVISPRFYEFGTIQNKGASIESAELWHDTAPPPYGDGPLEGAIPESGRLQPAPTIWLGASRSLKRWPDCVMGFQTHIPGFFHRRVVDAFIKHGITGYRAIKARVRGSASKLLAPELPQYYWIVPTTLEDTWPTRVHAYLRRIDLAAARPAEHRWLNSRDETPEEIHQSTPVTSYQPNPVPGYNGEIIPGREEIAYYRTVIISKWNGMDFSGVRPMSVSNNGYRWYYSYGDIFCTWRVKVACEAEGLKLGFAEMSLPNDETAMRSQ